MISANEFKLLETLNTPPHSSSLLLTPPHSSSLLLTPPHSSSLLLTPPHSSSLLLTPPHSSSLLLTPPHSSSLLLTPPHSFSLLLTPPHSSSLLLTPPHSFSLLLTPPHSSSLLLTPPHSSSLLLLTPPPQKSGSIGLYITTLQLFFLQKTQKMPIIRWQSALCLREKCCLDCILYDCNYCPPPGRKFQVPFPFQSAPRNRGPPIFCCFLRSCFERVLFNCRELVLLRDRSLITGEGGGAGGKRGGVRYFCA